MQTAASLNTSEFSDEIAGVLKTGAVARYREFAPVDAADRILATLCVGMQNAAMTSLEHAANVDCFDVRSQELRNATRAAKVVVDLMGALDRHRGRNNQDVQVRQVTVGNVNAEGRHDSKPDETGDPTDASSDAEG